MKRCPTGVNLLAFQLLRRHVGHGSQGGTFVSQLCHIDLLGIVLRPGCPFCQAEIHQFYMAVVREHDVGGLQIAMHDALLPSFLQGLCDL